ncbi:hypothetical protein AB0K51_16520 [Kitasatospora sp. NPDC049285]
MKKVMARQDAAWAAESSRGIAGGEPVAAVAVAGFELPVRSARALVGVAA